MGRSAPAPDGFGRAPPPKDGGELAYALPPADKAAEATLSSLWKFTAHLALGVTDSGACGFKWSTDPNQSSYPWRAAKEPPGRLGGAAPASARESSAKGKMQQGGNSNRPRSAGPGLRAKTAGQGLEPVPPAAPAPPTRPLPDRRHLGVAIPRAFHSAIQLEPLQDSRSPASSSTAAVDSGGGQPLDFSKGGYASRLPPARSRLQQASFDQALPRALPALQRHHRGLEDYIGKACQEHLSTPGSATLIYCTADSQEDYRRLLPGQFFNHFQHNHEVTTKNRLSANLVEYQISTGYAVDNFFPRSYDLSQRRERADFVLDFRRCAALKVACLVQELQNVAGSRGSEEVQLQQYNVDVLVAVNNVLECWLANLKTQGSDGEVHQSPPIALSVSITDGMWEAIVLYAEVLEAQFSGGLQLLDADVLRHPRRWKHRLGGTPLADEASAGGAVSGSRPEDVQAWPEFQGHCWTSSLTAKLRVAISQHADSMRNCFAQATLQANGRGRNVWIVKPGTCSKGSGVKCSNHLPELLHQCDTMPNRIVQKYIERPLLLFGGRKFDIRQWVLVRSVSPLKVFIFSDCYLRLCNEMYDIGDLRTRERHISNWQVNKSGNNIVEGAVASLQDFQGELHRLTGHANFWQEHMLPQMQKIVVQTLRAVESKLTPRAASFELLGFDLLVDDYLNMWLLEVNLSPACEARTPFLEDMLTRMTSRLVEVAILGKEEPDGQQPDWIKVCDDKAARELALQQMKPTPALPLVPAPPPPQPREQRAPRRAVPVAPSESGSSEVLPSNSADHSGRSSPMEAPRESTPSCWEPRQAQEDLQQTSTASIFTPPADFDTNSQLQRTQVDVPGEPKPSGAESQTPLTAAESQSPTTPARATASMSPTLGDPHEAPQTGDDSAARRPLAQTAVEEAEPMVAAGAKEEAAEANPSGNDHREALAHSDADVDYADNTFEEDAEEDEEEEQTYEAERSHKEASIESCASAEEAEESVAALGADQHLQMMQQQQQHLEESADAEDEEEFEHFESDSASGDTDSESDGSISGAKEESSSDSSESGQEVENDYEDDFEESHVET